MLERMQQERLSITRMGCLLVEVREKGNCGHRCRWGCVFMFFLDHFTFLIVISDSCDTLEICRKYLFFPFG